jgi:hypothetical protein
MGKKTKTLVSISTWAHKIFKLEAVDTDMSMTRLFDVIAIDIQQRTENDKKKNID